jgi:hypothetical protein
VKSFLYNPFYPRSRLSPPFAFSSISGSQLSPVIDRAGVTRSIMNMYNKQKKSVLIIPLSLLALLLMGTLGIAQLTHATNESSYLYGKKTGRWEWNDCSYSGKDEQPSCYRADDMCQSPTITDVRNETTGYLDSVFHYDVMTNKTACIDGYVHEWNHLCDPVTARKSSVDCPTTFVEESRQ